MVAMTTKMPEQRSEARRRRRQRGIRALKMMGTGTAMMARSELALKKLTR
jgi:hypothetical protein